MRVLFLTLGDETVASSRIRAWIFAQELRKRGHEVVVIQGPSRGSAPRWLVRRWDVCVVQKWMAPTALLKAIRGRAATLIYDCDDALLLPPDSQPPGSRDQQIRTRRRIEMAMGAGLFDGLTVSTGQLARDFEQFFSPENTLIFPGPAPQISPRQHEGRGIVWLGSPATQQYIIDIAPQLTGLTEKIGEAGVVRGVGATSSVPGLEPVTWSLEVQERMLEGSQIGLFPQPEGEWEGRKSGYKLLEYASHGVVPVAQYNAAAIEILGIDYPYLVRSNDWKQTVERAIDDLSDSAHRLYMHQSLHAVAQRFSYHETANTWEVFVADLRGA